MADFTLDDAHDWLTEAAILLGWWQGGPVHYPSGELLKAALDAIEAQLPEPCPECGSDQCGWVDAWSADWGDECRPVRECRFLSIPITVIFD